VKVTPPDEKKPWWKEDGENDYTTFPPEPEINTGLPTLGAPVLEEVKHLFHALLAVSWRRRSQPAALLVTVWSEVVKTEAVNPLTQLWPRTT